MPNHSLEGLIKWVRREEWRSAFEGVLDQHLGPACAKADLSRDDLISVIGVDGFGVLWGCVFEDFLGRDLGRGRNIVDDYLKRRGWNESASNRHYMTALRSSVMSLYEVSSVAREESFLARDLVRGGEPIRVSERSATRTLRQWDRIAARLVQVGPRWEMSGGVLPFDHDTSEVVLQSLRRSDSEPKIDVLSDTDVRGRAALFTTIWLDDQLTRTLNPRMPQISNSDGEELVFITVHYPLASTATVRAIRVALGTIVSLREEGETLWNWIAPKSAGSKKQAKDGQTFVTMLDDGALVLGTIEIKEKALTLSVNSEPRAQRGRALIEPILKGFVGEPLIERQTVEQARASAARGGVESHSGLSPQEERAVVHQALTEHYGRMLDEPIPSLGAMTPKNAVKTERGREQVIAWLKMLENHSFQQAASDPIASYDFSWLWEELGILDYRR